MKRLISVLFQLFPRGPEVASLHGSYVAIKDKAAGVSAQPAYDGCDARAASILP